MAATDRFVKASSVVVRSGVGYALIASRKMSLTKSSMTM